MPKPWVFSLSYWVFFLSFEFFGPWVFFKMSKKKAVLSMNFLRSWNDIHYHEWIQGQGSRHQKSFACFLFDVMLYSSDRVWHASVFLQQPCLIKKIRLQTWCPFLLLEDNKEAWNFFRTDSLRRWDEKLLLGIIFTLLEREPFSVQVIFVLAYVFYETEWRELKRLNFVIKEHAIQALRKM